jgi:hypothetical protein
MPCVACPQSTGLKEISNRRLAKSQKRKTHLEFSSSRVLEISVLAYGEIVISSQQRHLAFWYGLRHGTLSLAHKCVRAG